MMLHFDFHTHTHNTHAKCESASQETVASLRYQLSIMSPRAAEAFEEGAALATYRWCCSCQSGWSQEARRRGHLRDLHANIRGKNVMKEWRRNKWSDQTEIFILARCYVEETLETLEACAVPAPSPEIVAHHQSSCGWQGCRHFVRNTESSRSYPELLQWCRSGIKTVNLFIAGQLNDHTELQLNQWPARFQFFNSWCPEFVHFFRIHGLDEGLGWWATPVTVKAAAFAWWIFAK